MEENIYMLSNDTNLKIRSGTVRYNNKILISDGKFCQGKNDKVNYLVLGPTDLASGEEPIIPMPKMKSYKTNPLGLAQKPNISHKQEPILQSGAPPGPHKEEKIALVLFLASGFEIWNMFR